MSIILVKKRTGAVAACQANYYQKNNNNILENFRDSFKWAIEWVLFLDDYDLATIDDLRTDANKLGFAVQLGVLRFIGTFPRSFDDVPYAVVEYVSKQLTINSHSFRLFQKDAKKYTN